METATSLTTAIPEDQQFRFGQRVYHRLYGCGQVLEEWGNFRACKACYKEAPLGAASKAVEINGRVLVEKKPMRCRDKKCNSPTQVITGAGTYDVIFSDGKTRSINARWLMPVEYE